MFESLSEKLSGILDKLTGRGALSEEDVNAAMREVRRALIEADVALEVVRSFVDRTRTKAVGAAVIKSVKPGQMVVKIVHDSLVETLGGEGEPIDLNAPAPVAIMLVGLQGAGKTTTAAKIAKRLADRNKAKVLMASLDVKRPAAQEQLRVLGEQVGVDTLPIVVGEDPVAIAKRAESVARLQGYDVVLLDTAGRTHIDEPLMAEMADIRDAAKPHEILLVADALTGQDAVNLAKNFNARVGITGIVLTRVDGDGRGGAALSMRAVTGKPIKLIGVGEKMDALEDFYPRRLADRILGMGDIVSLVERAAETLDLEKAAKMAEKMRKGVFDYNDLSEQLSQIEKMGGMGGIMGMLPGMAKMKDQIAAAHLDEKQLKRQRAIISSMTAKERRNPHILTDDPRKASRKKRIAAGAGVQVEVVNRLIKQHRQMADMMKAMGGAGGRGMMGKLGQMMGLGSGMPAPTPEQIEAHAEAARRRSAAARSARPSRRAAARRVQSSPDASRPWRRRAKTPRPRGRLFSLRRQEEVSVVLETPRLLLREWREDDLDAFEAIGADEKASRFTGGGGPMTRADAWRRMAYFVGHRGLRGYGPFAIEEKATGACIGWCGPYFPEGWPDREISYALASAARGKGYATEAALRALAYAYRDLRWSTAISFIALENSASIAVANRLGAKLRRLFRRTAAKNRRVPASAAGGALEGNDSRKGKI